MSQQLQFEKAEYTDAGAAIVCAGCQGALIDSYFAISDRILCRGCAERVRAELANQGSRAGRAARALGAGAGAALLGTLLYYGVLAITGYEFGLIAIVVGYGVGAAVRWGSHGRGGWAYQGLAIALTYLSIVSAYIPPIIQELRKVKADTTASATSAPGSTRSIAATDAPAAKEAVVEDTPESRPTVGRALLAVAFLIALVSIAPFLAGLENIMGLIIIGIGLYEAWKLNRRVSLEISGPHPVNAAPAAGV
jgi:hypothetical protein